MLMKLLLIVEIKNYDVRTKFRRDPSIQIILNAVKTVGHRDSSS
jgi:hypothetical protein